MLINFMDLARGALAMQAADLRQVLIFAAGLSFVFLILPLRMVSIGAFAAVAIAAGLWWTGVDSLIIAVLLLGAATFLAVADNQIVRHRIGKIERRLGVLGEGVQQLEIAHERRQAFLARRPLPVSVASSDEVPAPRISRDKDDGPVSRSAMNSNGVRRAPHAE